LGKNNLDSASSSYCGYFAEYPISDEKYENLFERTKYIIIDGREYIEEVETDGMTFHGSLRTQI
jgi:hypothetical protein